MPKIHTTLVKLHKNNQKNWYLYKNNYNLNKIKKNILTNQRLRSILQITKEIKTKASVDKRKSDERRYTPKIS